MDAVCGCKGIRTCLVCDTIGDEYKNINQPASEKTCCRKAEAKWVKTPKLVQKLNKARTDSISLKIDECRHDQNKVYNLINKLTGRVKANPIPEGNDQELEEGFASFFLEKVIWDYCINCRAAWTPGGPSMCTSHTGSGQKINGIHIISDFISPVEESEIVKFIDQFEWKLSQSGRRKQDYGPKVNFKKKKLKLDCFSGLPPFSKSLVQRMNTLSILEDFKPIEQCHLEYIPERGSSIDPHFDDWWVWGERLVTINLLSDSYLVFELMSSNENEISSKDAVIIQRVKVDMPRYSLIVVAGDARYKWTHAIPREAICSRRIAVTYRELASEFLPGGKQSYVGEELMNLAQTYNGTIVS